MAPSLFAQAPVEVSTGVIPPDVSSEAVAQPSEYSNPQDSNPQVNTIREIQDESAVPSGGNSSAQMFYRLQRLEQEVQRLRGILEEQNHELTLLKKQRMDDYLDLDRRVSQLQINGGSVVNTTSGTAPATALNSSTAQPTPRSTSVGMLNGDERTSYKSAFSLLSKRQFDQAKEAMKEHLKNYPEGSYAANAHYWLGEIYLLQQSYEDARQWFVQLLDKFPQHRKVSDAKFKLGKVYHLIGDSAKAKELLKEVAASNSDAANLARQYLEANLR